uniref:Uncharacterized protein n=1 Tax=Panagrolaimus sp. ES5 TaxID=591445 RepID=A0AC34GSL7_9BILA
MLSRLNGLYPNKKQFIGFIKCENRDQFDFVVLDSLTEEIVASITYKSDNVQILLDVLLTMDNVFKAVIVDLFQLDLRGKPYEFSFEYCKELRKILRQQEIANLFVTDQMHICVTCLIVANLNIEIDDTVLFLIIHDYEIANVFITDQMYTCVTGLIGAKLNIEIDDSVLFLITHDEKDVKETFGLWILELKFTPKGYLLINHKTMVSLNCKADPEDLHQEICAGISTPPRYILVPSYGCEHIPFKKIFKSDNLMLMDKCIGSYQKDFMIETCKWLLDKSYIKYHILPICARNMHVYGQFGKDENNLDIMKININDQLPITKTVFHSKSFPFFRIVFDTEISTYRSGTRFDPFCHGIKTILTIDEENFEEIHSEVLFIKDFDEVPFKLDNLLKSKVPFIGFFDNLSFVATYKEPQGYEFLEGWKGVFGIDCFISFYEKKPKFGLDAMDVILAKNTFVVFDLLKIMSMPSDDIKIDKTWGFTITKDENNPVLLQFDNYDGAKSVASPAFLMALILRQQMKAIKAETNEKAKELAFWIAKQSFDDEEYKRIQEGIAKSCELLKLEFTFLDPESFTSTLTETYYCYEDVLSDNNC